jgi:hypothetical protein
MLRPVAWPLMVPKAGVGVARGAVKLEAPAARPRALLMLAAVLMVPTFSPALTGAGVGAGGGGGGAGGGVGAGGGGGGAGGRGARHMILISCCFGFKVFNDCNSSCLES